MAFENLKSTGIKYVLTKLKDYFLQIKDAVKSVNGEEPDETGDITINSVPYARNLESESSHRNYDTFIQRTAGGDGSVTNGEAWLMLLRGNSEHDGFVPEVIDMQITALSDPPITATIDRDTFVSAVSGSGVTTLVYTTEWNTDPATYGVTVTGEPVAGDTITIDYTAEVRGTITVADPQSYTATGWNLYDHSSGYARVIKYEHGYRIDGTYTGIKYAATPTGTQTGVVVNEGNFDIPADGYIIVTGGNSTDTAIYPTWEDWTDGHEGDFEAYSETTVDLSGAMASVFPYGLLKAGDTVDELDLNLGQATSRVERLIYTEANLTTAKESGREYEYDQNYIYLARASAVATPVSISGNLEVNDHGIEFFTGTDCPVYAEILYGNNLKNKLERDVLTISAQSLTSSQKNQARKNIGLGTASIKSVANNLTTDTAGSSVLDAYQGKVLSDRIDGFNDVVPSKITRLAGALGAVVTIPNNGRHFLIFTGAGVARYAVLLVNIASNGSAQTVEVYKGENITITTSTNTVTYIITGQSGTNVSVSDFALQGDAATVAAYVPPEPEPTT